MTETTLNYCYVHPTRETSLRCKRCERYICTSCARSTPTGYMCRDCVRSHQKTFDTALWYDYLTGFGTSFLLSLVASVITVIFAPMIGFYMIFLAAGLGGGAGVLIGNIVLRVISKRRSKPLFLTCAAGVVAAALVVAAVSFFTGNLFALLWLAIYAVIVAPVVYSRVSGIRL
jgi:hypothetical protein